MPPMTGRPEFLLRRPGGGVVVLVHRAAGDLLAVGFDESQPAGHGSVNSPFVDYAGRFSAARMRAR
jgi:hypothetical protein